MCAATTPGARRQTGAGDDHAQPAHARVLGVVGDDVGVAVGRHHADLAADAALGQLLLGLLHRRQVALCAHHDADHGASTGSSSNATSGSGAGELGLRLQCSSGHDPLGDVAAQLPPVEVDPVGGSVGAGAGVGEVGAERGDTQHPAAGGDERRPRVDARSRRG